MTFLKIKSILTITFLFIISSCNVQSNMDRTDAKNHIKSQLKNVEILINCFNKLTENINLYIIDFGVLKNGNINLQMISINITNGKKEIYGGINLDNDSSKLKEVLKKLNWTESNLIEIQKKMSCISFENVRLTQNYGKPVTIRNKNDFYEYIIYPLAISDKIAKDNLFGPPVGKGEFEKRIFLARQGG